MDGDAGMTVTLRPGIAAHIRNPTYVRIVRMVIGAGAFGIRLESICERLYPTGWATNHNSVESMRTQARVRIFRINKEILRPLGFEISARTSYAPYALRAYRG